MGLSLYREKRNFRSTSEPKSGKPSSGTLIFVIQKHNASRLHYDFRLEMEGVLKSWAVPKGPSLNPADKRLAMMVEDHPYDYKDFEGIIPEGNYGAGDVIVWDNGTYEHPEEKDKKKAEKLLLRDLKKGHVKIIMHGSKLKGEFDLVKINRDSDKNEWLLFKKKDKYAKETDILKKNKSVISGHINGLYMAKEKKATGKKVTAGKKISAKKAVKKKTASKKSATGKKSLLRNATAAKAVRSGSSWKPSAKAKAPGNFVSKMIRPMLAEIKDAPFDDKEWIFEIKYDGFRALANISDGKVNLYSRNEKSFNDKFHDIVQELKKIKMQVILDGEIVIEDEKGYSRFQLLQNYGTTKGTLKYYVFDILHLNGVDVKELPLIQRKELLRKLLDSNKLENIFYSEHIESKGIKMFKAAEKKNMEGIIAKRADSVYTTGRRTTEWLKIKIQKQQEAVIIGYTEPTGGRTHIGSLILGVYENEKLKYIGNCGTGFNEKTLEMLYGKFTKLKSGKPPVSEKVQGRTGINWLKPKLVCEVKFSEWTTYGIMRHPVYLGLRNDKDATQVKREVQHIPSAELVGGKGKKVKAEIERKKRKVRDTGMVKTIDDIKTPDEILTPDDVVKTPKPPKGKNDNDEQVFVSGRIKVALTNPNKIYWPVEKITKGMMVDYYKEIAPVMLPYLKDRPQSLHRFPNGISQPSFFQKDLDTKTIPAWVKTTEVFSTSTGKTIDYLICNNEATLVWMANLGCIEINPWNSRFNKPENPDWMVIDLDPEEIDFKEVVRAAKEVNKLLESMKINSFIKTSGATGMHIYVPLKAKYDYDMVVEFARFVATEVNNRLPKTTSIVRSPAKRKHKVYLDFLQNRRGQTLAAPYSLRPKPGATVSTPLEWDEVTARLSPKMFTMKNIFKRLEKTGDLWKPVISEGIDLKKIIGTIR